MSEFEALTDPAQRIIYDLGGDGKYHIVTQDTPEQVRERFGGVPEVDLIFMYPPIGSQRVNMGRALWEENVHFKEVRAAAALPCFTPVYSAATALSSRLWSRVTRWPRRCCRSRSWRCR